MNPTHAIIDLKPGDTCREPKDWEEVIRTNQPLAACDLHICRDPFVMMNATARNLSRKAARAGFTARHLTWAERTPYLEQIAAVNTSAEIRQGRPMSEGYRLAPVPYSSPAHPCPSHSSTFHAVFEPGGVLVGYISGNHAGELSAASQILGHASYLKDGIMYLLWTHFVQFCIDRDTRFVVYGHWNSGTPGLVQWKRNVGLSPYLFHLKKP